MNTRFHYIYRDGDNYKESGEVIFTGEITEAEKKRLGAALDGGQYFTAHQIGVPEVFLWDPDEDYDEERFLEETDGYHGPGSFKINESDHSWHEFCECELTEQAPTDAQGRTIEQFVAAVEAANRKGWEEFEPEDRRG